MVTKIMNLYQISSLVKEGKHQSLEIRYRRGKELRELISQPHIQKYYHL